MGHYFLPRFYFNNENNGVERESIVLSRYGIFDGTVTWNMGQIDGTWNRGLGT